MPGKRVHIIPTIHSVPSARRSAISGGEHAVRRRRGRKSLQVCPGGIGRLLGIGAGFKGEFWIGRRPLPAIIWEKAANVIDLGWQPS